VTCRTPFTREVVTAPSSVTVAAALPSLYGWGYSIAILYKLARKAS
jgi:hypothetical protein